MAKTILQIQQMITDKYDIREIINEIVDYIQANPGGGGSGGVQSVTGDLVDNTDADNPVLDISAMNDVGSLNGIEEVPLAGAGKTTTQAIADLAGGTTPSLDQVLGSGNDANANQIVNVGVLAIGTQTFPNHSLLDIKNGVKQDVSLINASYNSGNNGAGVSLGAWSGEGDDAAYLELSNGLGNASIFRLYADEGYFRDQENNTLAYWDATEFELNVPIKLNGVQEFADNAAAVTGGLAVGTPYRTGDVLKIVHA